MSYCRSGDPLDDFERRDRVLEERLARRPVCHNCGKHIQDEEVLHYEVEGVDFWLCLGCVEDKTEHIEVD